MPVLIAACCAGAMVVLARAGANADLRAALRTTMILVVVWEVAFIEHRPSSLRALSRSTWLLLILSLVTIAVSWILLRCRARGGERLPSIDKVNLGFAILFATLLIATPSPSQSWISALAIIAGAAILAVRAR